MRRVQPKVSVIIPAYNVERYLKPALESLQKQSLHDFEALIVDDGSTDETAAIALRFCQADDRFQLLQKTNGGLSSARNHGIRHAIADYIALLDGDDVYYPDKLLNHVAILNEHSDAGVVYSGSRIIREDGRPTLWSLSGKPIAPDPLIALLCKNFVGHGSNGVFRRSLIDHVGWFDESLRSAEDLDFWLRIAALKRCNFYRESRILCGYRVRPSALSVNVSQMHYFMEKVIQAAHQRSPEATEFAMPGAYAYLYRYLARLSLTANDFEQAQAFMDRAWQSEPSIFYRDPRSLLTLLSVQTAPMTKRLIRGVLGA